MMKLQVRIQGLCMEKRKMPGRGSLADLITNVNGIFFGPVGRALHAGSFLLEKKYIDTESK